MDDEQPLWPPPPEAGVSEPSFRSPPVQPIDPGRSTPADFWRSMLHFFTGEMPQKTPQERINEIDWPAQPPVQPYVEPPPRKRGGSTPITTGVVRIPAPQTPQQRVSAGFDAMPADTIASNIGISTDRETSTLKYLTELLGISVPASKSPEGQPALKAQPRNWPTAEDAWLSSMYDMSYGDRAASYVEPWRGSTKELSRDVTQFWYEQPRMNIDDVPGVPIDEGRAQNLHRAWLAARGSAITELGFDPSRLVRTVPGNPRFDAIAGAYQRNPDVMWQDMNHEEAALHESAHRGIQKLREAGVLPTLPVREEYVVRALVHRLFPNIERGKGDIADRQIETALRVVDPKLLDAIEAAAANLKAYKRGPR